ncbi:outer membrane protein assembly factor BamA [Alkalilimnicola ehrlichii]|uniref:outer membrane protein assembly factor BamA n=1 Tax=Alkalilimnicola ehrlichii TaxID=351052 RepID=UPI000E2F463B|nr:outer membrane protein assembly factor BamA [Alkalilimnicola ehrlichii]RFA28251.1 outer membrane protein assembly factor BamA [Alkalilimnicola ehrlichii]
MGRSLLVLFLLFAVIGQAKAFEAFEVEDIRVEGLRRIDVGTVLNYLPVSVNDVVDQQVAANAIRSLYQTGFFQDVGLERDNGVLVVEVVERPAIARIELRGNRAIGDDALLAALNEVGLAEGRVFNRFLLNDIERELRRQYLNQGQYGMQVESTVSPLPRNRVGIRIDVTEGDPARIREINFVGNEAVADSTLQGLFEQGPRRWYQFFSRRDQYSREQLAADLERLTSYYHDRGYINFNVSSTQVSISPDRRDIYITVNVSEGEQYDIGDVTLAGNLIVDEAELRELLATRPGDQYSRQGVTQSSNRIRERLGQEGYAFANVNPVPEVDEDTNTVSLVYYVDPGKRVYVRRINIAGNYRTQDEVIRRELRQMEGGWLSSDRLRRSQTRLQRLGFFSNVNIETPQVPGTDDQVDVNVSVQEQLSGSLQAGVGYGDYQGFLVNFSVEQDNVLGTGDRLSFAINNSRVNRIYSLAYTERYHTIDGVSRSFNASLRETQASRADLSDYGVRAGNLGVGYNIPINEDDSINVQFSYENLRLDVSDTTAARILDFTDEYGERFDNYKATLGWTRDTRNRAFFPNFGGRQQISAAVAVPGSDLEFYKLSYNHKRWFPITDTWTLSVEGRLAYGDGYGNTDELPFFENYYAGGISTVRGYRGNSLGPRDEVDDRPLGGNARILGSAELIFPVPFTEAQSLRLFGFLDGGNVFDTTDDGIDLDELRYSTGVGLIWLSPLGALSMSLGWPLNEEPEDRTQRFQFSLGTFF